MAENIIEFEDRKQYAILRINRPEVHNAVNGAVMERLEEVQKLLHEQRDLLVLIITGAGEKSFCAGGDIKYFATLKSRDEALAMSRRMQSVLNGFRLGNQLVIAAVNGSAFGGGCEILTACHYRIAAAHARFSFRQAANGIITGWGGGVRLFQQINASRALRLLTTSETIDAREAAAVGFIDEVVQDSAVLEKALSLAESIVRNSPASVRTFLQILQKIQQGDLETAIELETERFGDLWIDEDFKRWLNTFFKKPPPRNPALIF
ncbi:MAG: enoyl-CoA hydratase/isomerase family protein [Candidatus Aminicenantes bacterium]|nr:enoyl-CoA hydratase/isomerase family protein [Candidatus Aminicenantes bacterium]